MNGLFRYRIESLDNRHNRADFCCGIESLDSYLRKYASQGIRKHIAATFVLLLEEGNDVAGYYTLSAASVKLNDLPEDISRKFPKYPFLPATLLGRLAVDQRFRSQGFGEILLVDALRRSLRHSREIASMAVIVDAMNDDSLAFYLHYGFTPFLDAPRKLFLSMKIIQKLFPESL